MKRLFMLIILALVFIVPCFAEKLDLINDFLKYPGLNVDASTFYNFDKPLVDGRVGIGTTTVIGTVYKTVDIRVGTATYTRSTDFIIAPSVALRKLLGDDFSFALDDIMDTSVGYFTSPDDLNNLAGHWASGVFCTFLKKQW